MKDPDPRALELIEKFIRDRHARIGDKRHAAYRQAADALEAAQAQEREARLSWEQAQKALAAARRELDDLWAEWEQTSKDMRPEWRDELAELARGLRALKKD